jgi:hypothetical protein
MEHDLDLLLSIAEIAGVFVGFGALISFTRPRETEARDLFRLGTVVTIATFVVIASIIPVALGRYELSSPSVWRWSSAVSLLLTCVGWVILMRTPGIRGFVRDEIRANLPFAFTFWVLLDIPILTALVLVLLGVFRSYAPGLYTTALVLGLCEAAALFSRLVYSRFLRI